jgi:hypothetical protein
VISLQDRTVKRTHQFHTTSRFRSVAHDIAEAYARANFLRVHVRKNGSQCVRIGMNVRKDGPEFLTTAADYQSIKSGCLW